MKKKSTKGSRPAIPGKSRSEPEEKYDSLPASRNGASGTPLRVGLFGIGLEAYWPQFKGLKKRLEGYLEVTSRRLAKPGMKVVNLGLVDSPAKAHEAGHRFRREDVDGRFRRVGTRLPRKGPSPTMTGGFIVSCNSDYSAITASTR